MKKWIKIILCVVIGIILFLVIDFTCIFTINRPLFAIKEDIGNSDTLVYRGLFYDTYNCQEYSVPQIKAKGTKFTCAVMEFDKIILENINNKITNYLTKEDNDIIDLVYNYIDSKTNKVVVGIIDNSSKNQDKFLYEVFLECCGKDYIEDIKDNEIIEFRELKDIVDAKIVVAKDNYIIVEVLKDSKVLKKDDKVTIKITRPTSGIIDFYVAGNTVRITFNGNIETPKIEFIN